MTAPNESGGWVAIWRSQMEHPLVGASNPEYYVAWQWLLFEAAYQPRRIGITNRNGDHTIITLERGQLSHSLRYMAEAWGWSVKSVRTFIKLLKCNAQIDTQKGTQQTVITICNYELYQNPESAKGTQKGTQRARKGHKEEQLNNLTKDSYARVRDQKEGTADKEAVSKGFLEFYAAYPKKKSRKDAERAYHQAIKEGVTHERIMAGLSRCRSSWRDDRFIPYPAKFLRNGGYDDQTTFREMGII